jgi:lipoate-protein ligase A
MRLACVCVPDDAAVVIGSAQPEADFDPGRLAAAGLALVRRRSGGGAVLLVPGRQVWVDVFVPSDDELAEPDVGKSFSWLGDTFAQAIANVLGGATDEAEIEVSRASVDTRPWSKVLCYAGFGAGEVTVAGRKVVGMSQRRDRSGAWIHSMALLDDAPEIADLLAGDDAYRARARVALQHAGLRDSHRVASTLTANLLDLLP